MFTTYEFAAVKALVLINKDASVVLAEFKIKVLAAPVKYRTNLVDRSKDDIFNNFFYYSMN